MQNGPFFPQNALFIHFSYEYRTFLIHSKIHSIVRQKYSFKEFIHSKNNLIIHSMKIFIFLKNAVSATPNCPGPNCPGPNCPGPNLPRTSHPALVPALVDLVWSGGMECSRLAATTCCNHGRRFGCHKHFVTVSSRRQQVKGTVT